MAGFQRLIRPSCPPGIGPRGLRAGEPDCSVPGRARQSTVFDGNCRNGGNSAHCRLTALTKVSDGVRAGFHSPGCQQKKIRRVDMRRKLVLFGLSAGMMVTALFHATPAMATDP